MPGKEERPHLYEPSSGEASSPAERYLSWRSARTVVVASSDLSWRPLLGCAPESLSSVANHQVPYHRSYVQVWRTALSQPITQDTMAAYPTTVESAEKAQSTRLAPTTMRCCTAPADAFKLQRTPGGKGDDTEVLTVQSFPLLHYFVFSV